VSPAGPFFFFLGPGSNLHLRTACRVPELLLLCESGMASPPKSRSAPSDVAAQLAERLSESLVRERLVPRFVDSYVVEHGRYGLQVHATLYRDLLALLQREALLASSARALDIVSKGGIARENSKLKPMKRKDALLFRQKFLGALTRHERWNAGDALEFQSDLVMYEEILARGAASQRKRKPFEVANHPFVDRCAFVLDSSFMEKARMAASHALSNLEALTIEITQAVVQNTPSQK
jgi:hypothetical protein